MHEDEQVEEEYREKMIAVMRAFDDFVNEGKKRGERKFGFVLLMFPFGDKSGRCNYMSNGADRKDIVTLFKEMIARFEGQPEMKGKA